MRAVIDQLQPLLNESIVEVRTLDPGYADHASDVWLIRTASREVVVRSSRLLSAPDREFWWGCKYIFGIDPRSMMYFEESLNMLSHIPDIPAPQLIFSAKLEGRDYLVVEKMKGNILNSFSDQSYELLYQFGVWLAKVHANSYDFYGNLARTKVEEKVHFHHHLSEVMSLIVEREYSEQSLIQKNLESILTELRELPIPQTFCPVLVDLDPSQFLMGNGKISAIVDVEAYVVAPREFDFIGLEYVMDQKAADAFIQGYTTILAIPRLEKYRRVYRYLYRLLGVQGSVDLDQ